MRLIIQRDLLEAKDLNNIAQTNRDFRSLVMAFTDRKVGVLQDQLVSRDPQFRWVFFFGLHPSVFTHCPYWGMLWPWRMISIVQLQEMPESGTLVVFPHCSILYPKSLKTGWFLHRLTTITCGEIEERKRAVRLGRGLTNPLSGAPRTPCFISWWSAIHQRWLFSRVRCKISGKNLFDQPSLRKFFMYFMVGRNLSYSWDWSSQMYMQNKRWPNSTVFDPMAGMASCSGAVWSSGQSSYAVIFKGLSQNNLPPVIIVAWPSDEEISCPNNRSRF